MTTVKRITDLSDYTTVLPYASELFGVYQPLLGWKSKRIAKRLADGYKTDKNALIDTLTRQFAALVEVQYFDNQRVTIALKPGVLAGTKLKTYDSVLLEKLAALLPPAGLPDAAAWQQLITTDRIIALLGKDVVET